MAKSKQTSTTTAPHADHADAAEQDGISLEVPTEAQAEVHDYTRAPQIVESKTYGKRPFDRPAMTPPSAE